MAAFGAKMVFFGALRGGDARGRWRCRPVPFVASFTSYFIALYLIEALYLRRLFAGGARWSRSRPRETTMALQEHAAEHAAEGAAEKFDAGEVDHRARLEQRRSIIR